MFEALAVSGLVTVRGFKIDHSDNITIGYCDVNANSTGKGKEGIKVKGGHRNSTATVTIHDCLIHGTKKKKHGVKIDKKSVATIAGSTIRNNGLNGDDKKGHGVYRKRDKDGGTPANAGSMQNHRMVVALALVMRITPLRTTTAWIGKGPTATRTAGVTPRRCVTVLPIATLKPTCSTRGDGLTHSRVPGEMARPPGRKPTQR